MKQKLLNCFDKVKYTKRKWITKADAVFCILVQDFQATAGFKNHADENRLVKPALSLFCFVLWDFCLFNESL